MVPEGARMDSGLLQWMKGAEGQTGGRVSEVCRGKKTSETPSLTWGHERLHSASSRCHEPCLSLWVSLLSSLLSPSSHQTPASCPVTDLWLHLCPQMDTAGTCMVRGEAGDSQLSFKSNKDDFPILVSFGGFVFQYQSRSPHFSPPPGPSPTLTPRWTASGRTLNGGNSHFVVVYLAFGVTQLLSAE